MASRRGGICSFIVGDLGIWLRGCSPTPEDGHPVMFILFGKVTKSLLRRQNSAENSPGFGGGLPTSSLPVSPKRIVARCSESSVAPPPFMAESEEGGSSEGGRDWGRPLVVYTSDLAALELGPLPRYQSPTDRTSLAASSMQSQTGEGWVLILRLPTGICPSEHIRGDRPQSP